MKSQPRRKLAVLPGLEGSRENSAISPRGAAEIINSPTMSIYHDESEKRLIPFADSRYNVIPEINENTSFNLRAEDEHQRHSENYSAQHIQMRVGYLEESNQHILNELQHMKHSGGNYNTNKSEKEMLQLHNIMGMIKDSNDIITQLSSRLRTAEEKLHIERENTQGMTTNMYKIKQTLHNTQRDGDDHHTVVLSHVSDVRQRLNEVTRKMENYNRRSDMYLDQLHHMKNQLELQAIQYAHLQNELSSRTKKADEDLRQVVESNRQQNDSNFNSEQNQLQLRCLLDTKCQEGQEAIVDLTKQLAQMNNYSINQAQQIELKVSELQATFKTLLHHQQEQLRDLEKKENDNQLLQEGERMKLKNRIQMTTDEISDKIIQKEIRLREDTVKKFMDFEKHFHQEESARLQFEKHFHDENESRWELQQKIASDEIVSLKNMRKNDKIKHALTIKKVEQLVIGVSNKLTNDRKTIEKVLLAEIKKREQQSNDIEHNVSTINEQLRVALSSIQEAIGNIQFRVAKEREEIMNEMRTQVKSEEDKLARTCGDIDARFKSIIMRVTQQESTFESRITEIQSNSQLQVNERLNNFVNWQSTTVEDLEYIRKTLTKLPQEIRESHERIALVKKEMETWAELETDARLKQEEIFKNEMQHITKRLDSLEVDFRKERMRSDRLIQEGSSTQTAMSQLHRQLVDMRTGASIQLASETKMRLEENSAIKRELARLRVDVQPLLWKQQSSNRTFIKQSSGELNRWGVYQGLRWFLIKMKWLRLLEISRIKKENSRLFEQSQNHGPTNYQFDSDGFSQDRCETDSWDLNQIEKRAEELEEPNRSYSSSPTPTEHTENRDNPRQDNQELYDDVFVQSDERSDVDLIDANEENPSPPSRDEANEQWYNREVVLPPRLEGQGRDDSNEVTNSQPDTGARRDENTSDEVTRKPHNQ